MIVVNNYQIEMVQALNSARQGYTATAAGRSVLLELGADRSRSRAWPMDSALFKVVLLGDVAYDLNVIDIWKHQPASPATSSATA